MFETVCFSSMSDKLGSKLGIFVVMSDQVRKQFVVWDVVDCLGHWDIKLLDPYLIELFSTQV